MRALLTTALILSTPFAALADPPAPIKIISSNGADIVPGNTTLVFNGEPGTRIHQVMATGASVASVGGYMATAYAETTQFLCTSPCTVEMPNGLYELRASDNFMFGDRFSVVANGPQQTWEVQDANAGLGLLGILGTGIGLGGALGGAMLLAIDDDEVLMPTGATVAMTLGSSALATVGIWALVAAFADAEQVQP